MPISKQHVLNDLSPKESWRLFRIMAEIVDGFDTLGEIPKCVSIFGSARTKPDHPLYKETERLSSLLVKEGYGVITGGGPGLMEAANRGAYKANGISVGLHIDLLDEQKLSKNSTSCFLLPRVTFATFLYANGSSFFIL